MTCDQRLGIGNFNLRALPILARILAPKLSKARQDTACVTPLAAISAGFARQAELVIFQQVFFAHT